MPFGYDAAGNTLSVKNNTPQYTYDWEHRLTQVITGGNTLTLTYDGDGNRVAKTVTGVTTRYLVDDRNLTGYAVPVAVRVVDALPRTPSLKVGRPAVLAMFDEESASS